MTVSVCVCVCVCVCSCAAVLLSMWRAIRALDFEREDILAGTYLKDYLRVKTWFEGLIYN